MRSEPIATEKPCLKAYDISANGFYFDTYSDYQAKADAVRNSYGEPVEEFEILFVDGEHVDCDLAKAFGVSQANLARYLEVLEDWDDDQKIRYIIAAGECGYASDCDPERLDIDIYEVDSLKELAEQFVEEGLFGDIPDRISCYLDYDLIARDLGSDYTETEVAGRRIVYRCG